MGLKQESRKLKKSSRKRLAHFPYIDEQWRLVDLKLGEELTQNSEKNYVYLQLRWCQHSIFISKHLSYQNEIKHFSIENYKEKRHRKRIKI